MFPFRSTLTEALILHMADRSDTDIAKYIHEVKVLRVLESRGLQPWRDMSIKVQAMCICTK